MNINKKEFQKVVEDVSTIIKGKSMYCALDNIRFQIGNGRSILTVTDNEVAIRYNFDSLQNGKDQDFLVDSRTLKKSLKSLKDEYLNFEIEDGEFKKLKLSAGKKVFRFDVFPSEDFPITPSKSKKDFLFSIDRVGIERLNRIVYSAATDTIKPVYNAFRIVNKDGKIIAVTTDSRRLSVVEIGSTELDLDLLVPLEAMKLVLKFSKRAESLFFYTRKIKSDGEDEDYNPANIFITIGEDENIEIISRMVDGQFPNYEHVIPKNYLTRCVFDKKELIEELKSALPFTRSPDHKIIVNVGSSLSVKIDNDSMQFENEIDYLNRKKTEGEIRLGINCHFLIESIENCISDEVYLDFTGTMSPVRIGCDDYTAVVMPTQITNH